MCSYDIVALDSRRYLLPIRAGVFEAFQVWGRWSPSRTKKLTEPKEVP